MAMNNSATVSPYREVRNRHQHSKSASVTAPTLHDSFETPYATHNSQASARARKHNSGNFIQAQNSNKSSTAGEAQMSYPTPQRKARPKREMHTDSPNPTSYAAVDSTVQLPSSAGQSPRRSPAPRNGSDSTPAKSAYAGPTFHASPAPSALPIPKFFSKSVPQPAATQSFQARLQAEGEKPATASPSPPADVTNLPATTESPLDIFFKADREEKARKERAVSTSHPEDSDISIEQYGGKRSNKLAFDRNNSHMNDTSNQSHTSGKELFMMELDGAAPDPQSYIAATELPATPLSHRLNRSPADHSDSGVSRDGFRDNLSGQKSIDGSDSSPRIPHQSSIQTPTTAVSCPPSVPHLAYQSAPAVLRREQIYGSSPGPRTPSSIDKEPVDLTLHYGNRNLSPLFKAARSESPKLTSKLRQEVKASSKMSSAPSTSADNPDFLTATSNRRSISDLDAATISRNYLQSHIKAAGMVPDLARFDSKVDTRPNFTPGRESRSGESQLRPYPSVVRSKSELPANETPMPSFGPPNLTTAQRSNSAHVVPSVVGASSQKPDLKSMEDDLRRILKLNVLNGSTTRVQ